MNTKLTTALLTAATLLLSTASASAQMACELPVIGEAHSLRAAETADQYVRHYAFQGWVGSIGNDTLSQQDGSFVIVPGLDDPTMVSLQSVNYPGYYLRAGFGPNWPTDSAIYMDLVQDDGTAEFASVATFEMRPGLSTGECDYSSVSFTFPGYPSYAIRKHNGRLLLGPVNHNYAQYDIDATFALEAPRYDSDPEHCDLPIVGEGHSFRAIDTTDKFIRHNNFQGKVTTISPDEIPGLPQSISDMDGTFSIVPGLADPTMVSLQSVNYPNHYLRAGFGPNWPSDSGVYMDLVQNDGTAEFASVATFEMTAGRSTGVCDYGSISFSFPGDPSYAIRKHNGRLLLGPVDHNYAQYDIDATFAVHAPFFDVN